MPRRQLSCMAGLLVVVSSVQACQSSSPLTQPTAVNTADAPVSTPASLPPGSPPPSSPAPGPTPTPGTALSACASLAPITPATDAGGGQLILTVSAPPTCQWTADARSSWFSIVGSPSGTGNGHIVIAVAPNTGGPRTGTIAVGPPPDGTAVVWQGSPVPCSYTVTALSESIPDAGAQFAARVTATRASCEWSATTDVPWITLTEGATGAGDGRVTATVAPNPGGARTGVVTVAGTRIALTQRGGCSYAISPRFLDAGREAATTVVTVTTTPGCAWRAVSSADWVTFGTPSSGAGPGSVTVTAAAAPTCRFTRTATVSIGGETMWVTQFVGTCVSSSATTGTPPGDDDSPRP